MMKTIFCDIDGCILVHPESFLSHYIKGSEPKFLPGVREKLLDWYTDGYRIILTTGRPESERQKLTAFFAEKGVFFNQLIMDCGSGIRYLINDIDPLFPMRNKAVAINIERNEGIRGIDLK